MSGCIYDFRFAICDLSLTQIFNLPYRRFATCRAGNTYTCPRSHGLPAANASRLQIGDTAD